MRCNRQQLYHIMKVICPSWGYFKPPKLVKPTVRAMGASQLQFNVQLMFTHTRPPRAHANKWEV